jgi:lipopolysaccharide transport system permease protein
VALGKSRWRNRQLIVQMTRHEVMVRYKGSAMELAWSFFNPVFMLVVYTFVFSEIFKSRWGGIGGDDIKTQFAVVLFVGMIVLSLFSEALKRAPGLILSNVNYVKGRVPVGDTASHCHGCSVVPQPHQPWRAGGRLCTL